MFRTEKQRKKLCSACPLAKVADVIGDPCTLILIRELLKGPKRFGDLEASLAGVSSRTLTKKLKELQENDLVRHKESNKKIPYGIYSLTSKGAGLHGIALAMQKYGQKYL